MSSFAAILKWLGWMSFYYSPQRDGCIGNVAMSGALPVCPRGRPSVALPFSSSLSRPPFSRTPVPPSLLPSNLLLHFFTNLHFPSTFLSGPPSPPPFTIAHQCRSPLDPLLASLAHFSSTADLTAKIDELFYMIDANGNGTLNYEEIRSGLLSLEGCPIRLSLEDLDRWVNFEERRLRAEIWREGAGNKLRAQYILRAPCRVALGICSRRRVRSNSSKSVPDFGITMRGCKT